MSGRPDLVLLGPQRFNPAVRTVADELGLDGRIAVVTAGWQEREAEDQELSDHLGGRAVNLDLYRRAEEAFARDRELAVAHRARQERLRELQRLYRLRLVHTLAAARALLADDGATADLAEPEREAALAAVRDLDAHHLRRVEAIDRAFEERWRPGERPEVARHRDEIAALLGGCCALALAGGHVAILLNRLRLFAVLDLAGKLPVIAWSAGAMTLAARIVLFHDDPPQGAGDAEVLETGLGRCPGVVPLPHATRRLRLSEPRRVALFARRFGPPAGLTLDPGARLDFAGGRLVAAAGSHRLTAEGELAEPVVPAVEALVRGRRRGSR